MISLEKQKEIATDLSFFICHSMKIDQISTRYDWLSYNYVVYVDYQETFNYIIGRSQCIYLYVCE